MIGAINIIHKPSGLNIYNATFGDLLRVNENLFSGFITALQLLIDEISHKSIDEVRLGEHTLLLVEDHVLTVSVLIDEMESSINIRKKIHRLYQEIYSVKSKDELRDWNGDMKSVYFIDELVHRIFDNKTTERVEIILENLERLNEIPGITYYGILTRDGELMYSSTTESKVNALVLKAFDSLESNSTFIRDVSNKRSGATESVDFVSTRIGTILFANVNGKYKIFAINGTEKNLGFVLMSVEKIIEKINYSLGLDKMRKTIAHNKIQSEFEELKINE